MIRLIYYMVTSYGIILRKVSFIMLKNNCIHKVNALSSVDFNAFIARAFIELLTILDFHVHHKRTQSFGPSHRDRM